VERIATAASARSAQNGHGFTIHARRTNWEFAERFLHKGRNVYLEVKLRPEIPKTNPGPRNRYTTEVVPGGPTTGLWTLTGRGAGRRRRTNNGSSGDYGGGSSGNSLAKSRLRWRSSLRIRVVGPGVGRSRPSDGRNPILMEWRIMKLHKSLTIDVENCRPSQRARSAGSHRRTVDAGRLACPSPGRGACDQTNPGVGWSKRFALPEWLANKSGVGCEAYAIFFVHAVWTIYAGTIFQSGSKLAIEKLKFGSCCLQSIEPAKQPRNTARHTAPCSWAFVDLCFAMPLKDGPAVRSDPMKNVKGPTAGGHRRTRNRADDPRRAARHDVPDGAIAMVARERSFPSASSQWRADEFSCFMDDAMALCPATSSPLDSTPADPMARDRKDNWSPASCCA